ncbi:MAG TPA: aldo/keto reductase [Candidatus Competibacter sp.]|nr:aldo/keto reductase [Candidatus Competibacter sp.]
MEQRQLGRNVMVSTLGMGCMGMSEFYGESDDSASLETLARALDLGINFFDTADTYGHGHNERLLGRFLRGRRNAAVVATKFGIVREPGHHERRIDNSPHYIRAAAEASLSRLGIDCIDLYYCHRRDQAVPIEDVVGAMAELVAVGKVRQIGLSEVSSDTLRRASTVHPIAAIQSEYSLWNREPEQAMLATCTEQGTTFVAYSPLGRAFLTGAFDTTNLAQNDFRRNNPRFVGSAAENNRQLVAGLTTFADARNLTNAQVALAWLLSKHPHVVPIPGTRRIAYLEQNIAAATIRLTPAEIAELDSLFEPERVAGARYPESGMAGIEGSSTPPL